MKTRTGNFPIGFRQVNTNWNRDIPSLIEWAVANKLEVIDLTTDPESALDAVSAAGLRIGSIDLPDNRGMISADPARRADARKDDSLGLPYPVRIAGYRRRKPHLAAGPLYAPQIPGVVVDDDDHVVEQPSKNAHSTGSLQPRRDV